MHRASPASDRPGQPTLDRLLTVLAAPTVVLSEPDGQVRGGGAQGVFSADVRLCSRLELAVDGADPVPVAHRLDGARAARFEAGAGPAARLVRHRRIEGERVVEHVELLPDAAAGPLELRLVLRAASDLAPAPVVKSGAPTPARPPRVTPGGVAWSGPSGGAELVADPPAAEATVEGTDAVLAWSVALRPGAGWALRLTLGPTGAAAGPPATTRERPGDEDRVDGGERFRAADPPDRTLPGPVAPRLEPLLRRSLDDLDALLLRDPRAPQDVFAAAGSPWFCTLFGRDSLWTARLLLPLGTDLAAGTLRTLARRQGVRHDPRSEEEPGKILHEVRPGGLRAGGLDLPAHYFGTIDATALWCCLLHDAWRAGLPDDQVTALLPHLEAAMAWMATAAAGTGFLSYRGSAGGGLANQGWKDSADGVRWADGTVAERPLALCEVQGYAHAAAHGGAALLDAFDRPGGERAREWARALATRFRSAFWIADDHGPYPAIALDGQGRPVTGPTSNTGHLLSSGLLDPAESALVAARLARPDLDSGRGLRTLSAASAGFAPLSYHCGSVWPHDTAIAVMGLAGAGHDAAAHALGEGLVAAAAEFDDRLPELYGVTAAGETLAYPTACRPQAWAAAGAVAVVGHLSGWPVPDWALAPATDGTGAR